LKLTKVVIITHGQICAQPRTVKQAISLSREYEVTVIYCPMSPWGDEFDNIIISENPQIRWVRVGAHPTENPLKFNLVRLRRKLWEIFYLLFGNKFHAALKSNVNYSQDLNIEAQKYKADLFIGHNLGSISAITNAAKNYNSKAYFDFEDFHRGEDLENSLHWKRTTEIENEFAIQLNGATAASELITEYYKNEFPSLQIETILNVFPKNNQIKFVDSEIDELKLFWFSQTIGLGRGLEFILQACAKVLPQPKITLLGNCSDEVKEKIIKLIEEVGLDKMNITFKVVVPESEIPIIASQHHIGLCTEDTMTLNRRICLTNKIFTYMLGKNALLMSNTPAQSIFFAKQLGVGQLVNLYNISEITECIQNYQDDRLLLENHRNESLRLAKETYNWEMESEKLLKFYKDSILI
jgi:hypothetical protein